MIVKAIPASITVRTTADARGVRILSGVTSVPSTSATTKRTLFVTSNLPGIIPMVSRPRGPQQRPARASHQVAASVPASSGPQLPQSYSSTGSLLFRIRIHDTPRGLDAGLAPK